jgi:hypothetical protein
MVIIENTFLISYQRQRICADKSELKTANYKISKEQHEIISGSEIKYFYDILNSGGLFYQYTISNRSNKVSNKQQTESKQLPLIRLSKTITPK